MKQPSLFDSPQFEKPSDKIKLSEPVKFIPEPKKDFKPPEVKKEYKESLSVMSEVEREKLFPGGAKGIKALKKAPTKLETEPQSLKTQFKQSLLDGVPLGQQLMVWELYSKKGLSAVDARDVIDELIYNHKFSKEIA